MVVTTNALDKKNKLKYYKQFLKSSNEETEERLVIINNNCIYIVPNTFRRKSLSAQENYRKITCETVVACLM